MDMTTNATATLERKDKPRTRVAVHVCGWLNVPEDRIPHPASQPDDMLSALRAYLAYARISLRVRQIGDIVVSTETGEDLAPWQHRTWGADGNEIGTRRSTIVRTDNPETPYSLTMKDSEGRDRLYGAFTNETEATTIHEIWTQGLLDIDLSGLPLAQPQMANNPG